VQGQAVKLRLDAVNLVIEKFFRNLDLLERVKGSFLSIRKETFAGIKDLELMQKAVERDQEAVNKLLGNGGLTSEELFDVLEHAQLATEWAAREKELKAEIKAVDKNNGG
jgi:hypothetical protein